MRQKILITGAAGFIGFHLCKQLLLVGASVTGVDNLDAYYDVELKGARLAQLHRFSNFRFVKIDLASREEMERLFGNDSFDFVINLAAQAGVRFSLSNPHNYVQSNIVGLLNVLEGCRHTRVKHLVFASSSSVYGDNSKMPYAVSDPVDHPISLYAATKRAGELMAHSYAHLYRLPCTGLRFFTVYGPWGRPDMSYSIFTRALLQDRPIQVYAYGEQKRDFTFIDDIVQGIGRVMTSFPTGVQGHKEGKDSPATSSAPFRLYNIGSNRPVRVLRLIELLEAAVGRKARLELMPPQPGDVAETWADMGDLAQAVGFEPTTMIEAGIPKFVAWYREYYHI